jgi:hypothetical protein
MTGLLESTDIHGGLIRYFPLDQARVDLCARACASDGECRAYTYVKPGAYNAGDAPMCYLKSSVDRTVVNPRVISGIVRDGPVAPRATVPPATTSRAPSPRCTELEAPLSTLRHGTAEQLGWGALGHRIKVNELRVAYTDHLSRLWQAAARALPEVADGRFGEFVQQHRDRSAATYEDFARAAAEFTAPGVDPRVSALARERIEQAQKAARSMRETIGAPLTRQSAQALVNKFLNTLAQSRQSLSGEIEADRQALAVNTTKRKALDAERQRLGCIVARE